MQINTTEKKIRSESQSILRAKPIKKLIMIRHAQSEWNAQDKFTGWADPLLTEQGKREAKAAGVMLRQLGYRFDKVYTSVLRRASDTAKLIMGELGDAAAASPDIELVKDWRLNERHYGNLQGQSKREMAEVVGADQVWRWRRGFLDKAPAMSLSNPNHAQFDQRYRKLGLCQYQLPNVESLKDTQIRALDSWGECIKPDVQAGKSVLVAAHGNTLRALIMALENMSVEEVEAFEIPTGVPMEFVFNEKAVLNRWRYLQPH